MTRQTFRRSSILSGVAAAALMLASAAPAFAQGNSQGKGNANRGANSSTQMSVQGNANSNGRNTIDRDFGRDRAAERMSDQGLARNRVGDRAERNTTAGLNREAARIARLRADERAGLTLDRNDRINGNGANKTGFCPPGQAKKAGQGSRFNC